MQLDLYVYECTDCDRDTILSGTSVSEPEVHLYETEDVYCGKCGEDVEHILRGLEGLDGGFVLANETDKRYCPLCDGACEELN